MGAWLLGLRPRLLAALLLSSAVTLAVAALALLSPLEQRLRSDGESTVLTALGAARPELAEITIDPATGHLNEAGCTRKRVAAAPPLAGDADDPRQPAGCGLCRRRANPERARLLRRGAPGAVHRQGTDQHGTR